MFSLSTKRLDTIIEKFAHPRYISSMTVLFAPLNEQTDET